jgi:hypothetical protein
MLRVEDIEVGKRDSAGIGICDVYARIIPQYAVYRTLERVLIHFSDDTDQGKVQRSALIQLNPLRGEINGLIDGWRNSRIEHLASKARRYNRRVADALIVSLEGDVATATKLLEIIKKDITDERTTLGQFQYLLAAFLMVVGVGAVTLVALRISQSGGLNVMFSQPDLWLGSVVGAAGAFFSIAIAIRNRTVLIDLQPWGNRQSAAVRVMIGAIAAVVLLALIKSGAIDFKVGNAGFDAEKNPDASWLYLMLVAFLGGFSERLVPDLLEKYSKPPAQSETETETTKPAAGAPGAAAAETSPAPPAVPDGQEEEDHCVSDSPVEAGAETPDSALPQASGGVSAPR